MASLSMDRLKPGIGLKRLSDNKVYKITSIIEVQKNITNSQKCFMFYGFVVTQEGMLKMFETDYPELVVYEGGE